MLFNAPILVLGFLPAFLTGFAIAGRIGGGRAALGLLLICSLFFYGWWNPVFLPLLIGSILGNYALSRLIRRSSARRRWLGLGLAGNLALLGWFKYAGLFAATASAVFGLPPGDWRIILPLGISFFTFQQIMYLADTCRGEAPETGFLDYACFVSFFAHLIAGPIVRPGEIIPQFAKLSGRMGRDDLAAGTEIFLLGLAKKLVLADSLAGFADPGFAAAAAGHRLTLIEAWVALLAYGAEIYFDFSGYSGIM